MDVKTTLREQMQAMHGTLEAAVGDCNPEAVARKLPGSTINSIGAIYAHTIFSEDGILRREFWDAVDRYRVTSFAGVPYTYQRLPRLYASTEERTM